MVTFFSVSIGFFPLKHALPACAKASNAVCWLSMPQNRVDEARLAAILLRIMGLKAPHLALVEGALDIIEREEGTPTPASAFAWSVLHDFTFERTSLARATMHVQDYATASFAVDIREGRSLVIRKITDRKNFRKLLTDAVEILDGQESSAETTVWPEFFIKPLVQ